MKQYEEQLRSGKIQDGAMLMFDGETVSILKYAGPREKNAIKDTFRFVRKLKRGDFGNILIDEKAPIHCAVLGELNENLRQEAEYCGLNEMQESHGYYGFLKS